MDTVAAAVATSAGENNIVSPYLTSFAILDSENKDLTMYVTSPDGGNLQIKMPKTILYSMIETEEEGKGNVTGSKFTVLIDSINKI